MRALRYNGATGYTQLPFTDAINPFLSGDGSLSVWVQFDSMANQAYIIRGYQTYSILHRTDGALWVALGTNTAFFSAAVTDTAWHLVGFTFTNSTKNVRLYIDGVFQQEQVLSNSNAAAEETWLGAQDKFNNGVVDGLVDTTNIWDVVLSDSEFAELFSLGRLQQSGPPPITPTPIGDEEAWYSPTLEDSTRDLTGNNHDGTYFGAMGTVPDVDPTHGGTRAYDFNGSNQYISVPNLASLHPPADAMSVGGWFKVSGFKSANQFLMAQADVVSTGWSLYASGTDSGITLTFRGCDRQQHDRHGHDFGCLHAQYVASVRRYV